MKRLNEQLLCERFGLRPRTDYWFMEHLLTNCLKVCEDARSMIMLENILEEIYPSTFTTRMGNLKFNQQFWSRVLPKNSLRLVFWPGSHQNKLFSISYRLVQTTAILLRPVLPTFFWARNWNSVFQILNLLNMFLPDT